MLYYDARLSADNPTVEVRIADVCTDPDDALIIAAVVRGLVQTAAAEWAADQPPRQWRTEVLRATAWRASRYGLAGTLVSPEARERRPAREVLASVVDRTREVLEAGGDLDRVTDGFERLLGATGAVRQRAAYERTGSLEGVVADLVRRTEDSWSDVVG
jgi:carboxylate-amine ligase